MDTSRLPTETCQLWQMLLHEPLLQGFVPIGGTALSLRIGYRISEDLDFAYLRAMLLKQRLNVLKELLLEKGIQLEEIPVVVTQEEFLESGMELVNYQQNYLAHLPEGSVKQSFVCLDPHVTVLLAGEFG